MASVFLTAEWKKLAMANYLVDAEALRPLLPARTELDTWEGDAYVSLVGFQFNSVRVRGWRIPFHTQFPEVNLRFYVRYKEDGKWKRGVVFVREIVPLRAVAYVANTVFHERYIAIPMRYVEAVDDEVLRAAYHWRFKGRWQGISLKANPVARELVAGSQEEFITEHFWGYAAHGRQTVEYQVEHPRWQVYSVGEYHIDCQFGKLYGAAFAGLENRKPQSVFLAEGSAINVYSKNAI
ncbi:MAG TPA: DUF2071 domain-containing protein [Puia sp.]